MRKIYTVLSFLLISLSASAQWSNDITENNQLTEVGRTLYEVDVIPTSDDITYVAYNGPYNSVITTFLQILDEDGNKKFDGDGIIVSDTVGISWNMVNERSFVDRDGNILLAVTDCRNATDGSKTLNYSIYKISPDGEMLWGETGVDLQKGTTKEQIAFMQMIQLEDKSYVFAWMEAVGYSTSGSYYYGIKLERLSEDGEFLWDETMELYSSTSQHTYPYLECAGNNQFILVYMEGSNSNVYARKIDFDGSSVWASDTKVYVGGFNTTTPIYLQIQTKPDPNGGVFIGWYDDRFYTGYEHAFISYVQADGSLKFSEGTSGLQLGYNDSMRSLSFDFIYNEDEDCIYGVWRGVDGSTQTWQTINLQKVSMQGELVWGTDGIEVEPLAVNSYGSLTVQNAEDGGVAVFYSHYIASYGNTSHKVVKYTADGNPAWEGGVYEFTPTIGNKGALEVSELINDEYWIASWQEDRVMSDDSANLAYAEKIYVTGPSASGISQTTSDDNLFAAKTADGTVTFTTNSNEAATITIYTVAGERIASIPANSNLVSYSTAGIASGVYIATITSSKSVASTRFVIK